MVISTSSATHGHGCVELLLELKCPGSGVDHTDVRVDIDPNDTVASLANALASHLVHRLGTPELRHPRILRGEPATPLDAAARVVDTGLVSGETVTLVDGSDPEGAPAEGAAAASERRARDGRAGALTLDVVAGPEAGRSVPLRQDVVVGRAAGCRVVMRDAAMSRQHFALHLTPDGKVLVEPNPAATNGTFVGGEPIVEPRAIDVGETIEAGDSVFELRPAAGDDTRRRDRLGLVPFNRVPYRRTVVRPQRFGDLPPAPVRSKGARLSLVAALMPAASSGAMVAVTGQLLFLGVAALSPILLIAKHIWDRRGGRKSYAKEKATFRERVATRAREVTEALEIERQTRLLAAPDLAELGRQAGAHMERLWERNRTSGDLLDLRLGRGDVESQVTAGIAGGGDESLRAEGMELLAHQHVVANVPLCVDLVDAGALGLWGDGAQVGAVARALVVQAACLHSPEDVVIAAAVADANLPGFEWLKWLPHTRAATSPLDGPHVEVGPAGARRLLANLLAVAASRRASRDQAEMWPRLLVVLDEAAGPDRTLVSQLLDVAPATGVHVIWAGEDHLQVPRQCNAVVECPAAGRTGRVRFTDPGRIDRMVDLDGAQPETARVIARALAPLRDASAASPAGAIPRTVSLLEAIALDEPTAETIARRWQRPRDFGLDLPLGMTADGPFVVDLVDQGPHALIAGTSGSGKSELLQSLVLSLAAGHSPQQVNFLFVDYKGGAASAKLRDLPHTVGYVTNLDGRMSRRALTSLRAELQRRMGLLEGRASDLREMLHVAPEDAPASLVIVVDEFATLVKEIPDFVAGMVDIAQRGRSLGVHLILATQRPTGVVDRNILANTNLRISLRVLDPSDSQNVIGTTDAADIPVPLRGRCYARTGPQALVSFQCAWSGAPFAEHLAERSITVMPFLATGADGAAGAHPDTTYGERPSQPSAVPGPTAPRPPASGATQLDVVAAACRGAAQQLDLPPVRRPWLEPLPEVVDLRDVVERLPVGDRRQDPGRVAVLGLSDDPENQAQEVAVADLEDAGGLVVFGTGGSGKTTLLRSIAAGMALQGSPDDVRIYALDFASHALGPVAELPQCGAVVTGDDPEAVTRLLTVLRQEIDQRRTALAAARAESLGALRAQAGTSVYPRIVLLLDGYGGFQSAFDKPDRHHWLDVLKNMVSAGRRVGVHCVLTADRRMGVPSEVLSAISARLVLRMASPDELVSLGVPAKVARDADELPNGRGFLGGVTEVQVACVTKDPSGTAQAQGLAALGAESRGRDGTRAPVLPELPTEVRLEHPSPRPLTAPLGIEDLTLDVVDVDLSRQHLLVVGPPSSGRSTALETVAWGLRASTGLDVKLLAMGADSSPLAALDLWDGAAFAPDRQSALVARLSQRLGESAGPGVRYVLVVDAAEDLASPELARRLEPLTRSDALRVVVASETSRMASTFTGWLSTLRGRRSAVLILQPESRQEVDTIAGVRVLLRPGQEFPVGRGVLVADRRWHLLQTGTSPLHAATVAAGPDGRGTVPTRS